MLLNAIKCDNYEKKIYPILKDSDVNTFYNVSLPNFKKQYKMQKKEN